MIGREMLENIWNRCVRFLLLIVSLALIGCDSGVGVFYGPTPSILSIEFTGEVPSQINCIRTEKIIEMVPDYERDQLDRLSLNSCQTTASWTRCGDETFSSYKLYRSFTSNIPENIGDAVLLCEYENDNQIVYMDNDITWGVNCHYVICTTNENDISSWSNEVEFRTPGDIPDSSLLQENTDADGACLTWDECTDLDFLHYTVFRSYTPGILADTLSADKLITIGTSDTLTYTDFSSINQKAYYAIRTTNIYGLHAWSNECLALLKDSAIVAWGEENFGQCSIPFPNWNFISITHGENFVLGLRSDGSILGWGLNSHEECEIPEPNTDFIKVAAGSYHCLAVKNTGEVIAWGSNYTGQCSVPSPNTGYVDVAAGVYHSLGLKSNGSIVGWGSIYYGQCNPPAPNNNFVDLTAGGWTSYGLKSNGEVVSWGSNSSVPSPNMDFVEISAGREHCLALRSDGTIVAWGNNQYGQCDVPSPNANFIQIAAGSYHSLGLKSPQFQGSCLLSNAVKLSTMGQDAQAS